MDGHCLSKCRPSLRCAAKNGEKGASLVEREFRGTMWFICD